MVLRRLRNMFNPLCNCPECVNSRSIDNHIANASEGYVTGGIVPTSPVVTQDARHVGKVPEKQFIATWRKADGAKDFVIGGVNECLEYVINNHRTVRQITFYEVVSQMTYTGTINFKRTED